MRFPFRRQIDSIYALSACIQMITETEESQQNIYFQLVQISRSLTPQDCANKSIATQDGDLIVGQREKVGQLIQNGLNRYRKSSQIHGLKPSTAFVGEPGIAILKPRKIEKKSLLLSGHPIVISQTSSNKVTILDPANDNPVEVLQMRIKPIILYYYSLILQ